MAALPNRARYERIFTDQMSSMFAKQRRELGKILRSGAKPGSAFWANVAKETRTNTSLLMLPVHERGGTMAGGARAAVKQAARDWALTHSKELATGLNQTSKEALAELAKHLKSVKSDRARNKLIDEGLKTIFGASRAEMIAVTEVTTAFTAGHLAVLGDDADGIWRISDKGKVCPRCRALNGTRRKVWGKVAPLGPPLHPFCNCDLDYIL